MRTEQNTNSRRDAARIVEQWLRVGTFPDRQLAAVSHDRAFLTEVVYGIARWRGLLDWVIAQLVTRPPADRVRAYLYVGLYQLMLMDSVATYAAVNETVNAVKHSRSTRATGFVNGVLRRALREKDAICAAISAQPLHVRQSHPEALTQRWTARYGADRAEALCHWNNTRPQVVIHPFAERIDAETLQKRLREAGVAATQMKGVRGAFLALPHGRAVHSLPGYNEGLFSVQDPSTWQAVALLDPQPGGCVLDACAAPGGKTTLIAERMRGEGCLIATDSVSARGTRLEENLARMRLSWVRALCADITSPRFADQVGVREFDRILLDVPCTNTGVLRRRADARWRFSSVALCDTVRLQRRMLARAASLLKPGGVLVYSTCSIEPEEGVELAAALVAEQSGLAIDNAWVSVPPAGDMDGGCAVRIRRCSASSL